VPSCRRYKRASAAAYVSASPREHTDREDDRTLKRNASIALMEAFDFIGAARLDGLLRHAHAADTSAASCFFGG